jgi:hypothetical protein
MKDEKQFRAAIVQSVPLYIELNDAKTRAWSDKIGQFGDLRPIYLVFCAFAPDNTVQHPRNSDVKTTRSNRSRHPAFIPSPYLVVSLVLGKCMTAKGRLMAALIVLLAHFATAAMGRSQKDPT